MELCHRVDQVFSSPEQRKEVKEAYEKMIDHMATSYHVTRVAVVDAIVDAPLDDFDQQVLTRRKRGQTFVEIADELGVTEGRVAHSARYLRSRGFLVKGFRGRRPINLEELRRRESIINAMRVQGGLDWEIAKALGISTTVLESIERDMRQRGDLQKRSLKGHHPGRGGISLQEEHRREAVVLERRLQDIAVDSIAEELNISSKDVKRVLRNLETRGHVRRRGRGRPKKIRAVSMEQRDRTIIAMRKKGATQEEIAEALGTHRSVVWKHIKQIREKYGEDVFTPEEKLWTVDEAASELGVTVDIIIRICDRNEVQFVRRGKLKNGQRLFTSAGMEALRQHGSVTGVWHCICSHCKKLFDAPHRHAFCSDECKKAARERDAAIAEKPLTAESLSGWHKELFLRRDCMPKVSPEHEEWITSTQAHTRTCFTVREVYWLGLRGFVTRKPHPTKIYCQRQVWLYATSEIMFAERVYIECDKKRY